MTEEPALFDAVYFDRQELTNLLSRWLENYDGVRYANDIMDTAKNWRVDAS